MIEVFVELVGLQVVFLKSEVRGGIRGKPGFVIFCVPLCPPDY